MEHHERDNRVYIHTVLQPIFAMLLLVHLMHASPPV